MICNLNVYFIFYFFAPIARFGLLVPNNIVLALPIGLGDSPVPDDTFGGLPRPRFNSESGEGKDLNAFKALPLPLAGVVAALLIAVSEP